MPLKRRYTLTVLVRVVTAVNVPVTELLHGLTRQLIQTGPAAAWAALLWAAVDGVHKSVVMGALARPTAWRGEA